MRLSRYFLPLLKETPSEAQIVSHRLMLRAGMMAAACHDDAGIVWPAPVASFDLKSGDAKTDAACNDLYAKLKTAGELSLEAVINRFAA